MFVILNKFFAISIAHGIFFIANKTLGFLSEDIKDFLVMILNEYCNKKMSLTGPFLRITFQNNVIS